MNTVAKILIVVNLVLAGGFLASAATFLEKQDLWKDQYTDKVAEMQAVIDVKDAKITDLDSKYAQVTEQSRVMQEQLGKATQEASDARQQADLLKEAFNSASQQLTNATAALEKAQDTINSNRQLIDSLQQERSALATSKAAALEAKEAAVRNLAEKELQFENLMAAKQTLEARVEELRNKLRGAQLTAETAVSKLGGGADVPMDQPHHMGQILTVDNGANVAVISLGSEDGVRPGFRYTVSRGNQYVGLIEITDVQARQSAGRSIKNLQKSNIQSGDRVMSR